MSQPILPCPNPECGAACELSVVAGCEQVSCMQVCGYRGPFAPTEDQAIARYNALTARITEPFIGMARHYCETRERERAILKSLKHCERHADGDGDFCSRATEMNQGELGHDSPVTYPLPECYWCDNCRENKPLVEQLHAVRRQIPGRMTAMRRAYRKDAGHDITQPTASLAQTPRPVSSAGESTGREGLVAGERERAEARAGSLRSRCEDSGREANGDSSSS